MFRDQQGCWYLRDSTGALILIGSIAMHDLHAIELPPPRLSHIEQDGHPSPLPKLTQTIAASTAVSDVYIPPAVDAWPTAKTFG